MSIFRARGAARFVDQVPVEPTLIPVELEEMTNSALLDLTCRVNGAVALIDELLRVHRDRDRALRPEDLPNALLDVRNKLAPGSQILPMRHAVPVIPGRAS